MREPGSGVGSGGGREHWRALSGTYRLTGWARAPSAPRVVFFLKPGCAVRVGKRRSAAGFPGAAAAEQR